MNSLITRLFAAFLLIILLVILVIGFALVVLLRNSPLVERQIVARLNEAARASLQSDAPPHSLSTQAAERYVRQLANTLDVRVLLADGRSQILADSHAARAPTLTLDFDLTLRDPNGRVGRARDANRRAWLYVARPVDAGRFLVFAAQPPRFPGLTFFLENLFWPLVEAGGVAALLSIVLAVLITRSIALPLQKMANVARGIARGDYAQAAPVAGPDEVRALGQSINAMSRQVQAAQQAQRDFLANVSHELKTPLTSIQGFAQAILDGAAASPEALQRSAGIIYGETDRMRRLVEGLLDLARLDAGLRALNRAPLDLPLVLTTVVEKFSLRARTQGINLVKDLSPVLPSMVGDADRLAQVFTNLLDNALKHTPAGGTVTLAAALVPTGVEITVKDTGDGIPPEDLSRIFERFYQVDKSRARPGTPPTPGKPGGVGLGLAITKEIVEAHGGSLTVESVVGLGSKFTIRLPVTHPDDATVIKKRKS